MEFRKIKCTYPFDPINGGRFIMPANTICAVLDVALTPNTDSGASDYTVITQNNKFGKVGGVILPDTFVKVTPTEKVLATKYKGYDVGTLYYELDNALNPSHLLMFIDGRFIEGPIMCTDTPGDIKEVKQTPESPSEPVKPTVKEMTMKPINLDDIHHNGKSIKDGFAGKAKETTEEVVKLLGEVVAADTTMELECVKVNLLNRIQERAKLISVAQDVMRKSSSVSLSESAADDVRGKIIPTHAYTPPVVVCKGYNGLEVLVAFAFGAILILTALFMGLL